MGLVVVIGWSRVVQPWVWWWVLVGQRLGSAVVWPWRLGLVKSKTMAEERERGSNQGEREAVAKQRLSLSQGCGKKKNKRKDLTPFGWVR